MSCTYFSIFSVLTFGQGQIPWRGERWRLPHPPWYRPCGTHGGAHHHCLLQRDTCRRYKWVVYQRPLPCDTCTRHMWTLHDHWSPLPLQRDTCRRNTLVPSTGRLQTPPSIWHVQQVHVGPTGGCYVACAAGTGCVAHMGACPHRPFQYDTYKRTSHRCFLPC